MDKHEKDIVGVYHSEQEAILAVADLKRQGYNAKEISVIGKNRDDVNVVTEETGTKAGEGAATGAITGGALGGLTGLLAGVGALAIPGIGPIVAAGPIIATLTGATAGAGVGGLSGALIGMGISEDKAKYYDESVKEGKILVLVDKKEGFTTTNDRNIPVDVDTSAVEGTKRTENHYNTFEDQDPSLRKEEVNPRFTF